MPNYIVEIDRHYVGGFMHRRAARRFVNSLPRKTYLKARIVKLHWFVLDF